MYRQFYSELNDLLGTMTGNAGIMTTREKNSLLNSVKTMLFGEDRPADVSEVTSNDEMIDPRTALNNFLDFVEDNIQLFDHKILSACRLTAAELWEAYYPTNRKEKQLVEHFKKRFPLI